MVSGLETVEEVDTEGRSGEEKSAARCSHEQCSAFCGLFSPAESEGVALSHHLGRHVLGQELRLLHHLDGVQLRGSIILPEMQRRDRDIQSLY